MNTITDKLAAALRDACLRLEGFIESDCECDNTHAANRTQCCLCGYREVLAELLTINAYLPKREAIGEAVVRTLNALAALTARQPASVADHHEPWHVEKDTEIWIRDWTAPDGRSGGGPMAPVAECEHATSAQRIVACVNACAGIPTATLEGAGFVLADDETPVYELVREGDR